MNVGSVDNDDVLPSALIVTVGMVLPAIPVSLAQDVPDTASSEPVPLVLIGAIEYQMFLVTLTVAFGLCSWFLLEFFDMDRISFLFTTLVWPWIVALSGLFLVRLIAGRTWGEHGLAFVFSHLTGGGQLILYGFAFMSGGVLASVLSYAGVRVTNRAPV